MQKQHGAPTKPTSSSSNFVVERRFPHFSEVRGSKKREPAQEVGYDQHGEPVLRAEAIRR